ncbi:MAG TPA: DNA-3-methyladenine glycosylase, partial [Saprospiraceae bacterium]|nr:DNA-3-methyladenine glycosylase [Saprospiraceae bacterium]
DHTLTGGPGKVCQAMGITQQYDGLKLWRDQHNIIIEAPHRPVPISCVTPRVGMSSRVAECANWPYRFYIKSNYVSRPLTISYDF